MSADVSLGATPNLPVSEIEVFDDPCPQRDYLVELSCPEFTCLCPVTGQPDFASLEINYVPRQLCVELKSLKLYLWSFRDRGAFHEAVVNEILDHLQAKLNPRRMTVRGVFRVRGGITTTVTASTGTPTDENLSSPK